MAHSFSMSHRGPDNAATHLFHLNNTPLYLAHNRLAIQDLSPLGNQPMESERFVIVFNGEIYNHLEIRTELKQQSFKTHSDTETLLYAFETLGITQTLTKLIGMFAIALLDKKRQKLYLIRDRVGIKPLYWTHQNNEFAFASELKGIPEHLRLHHNDSALVHFMSLGYISGDRSIYQDVHKLSPGYLLCFDGTKIETQCYWQPSLETISIDFDTASVKLEALIRSSIRYRLLSDLEVGAFLSGGVDSSLVSAIMQQESAKQIKTFSIGFDNPAYNEAPYAREVAKHIGSDHHEFIFGPHDVLKLLENFDYYFDEPFGDASALPTMLLSQQTKQHVTVALSGDGGDELFLGYERYFFTQTYTNRLNAIPSILRPIISEVCRLSRNDKLIKMAYPIKYPKPENIYAVISTATKPWELAKIFQKEYLSHAIGTTNPSYLDLVHYSHKLNLNDLITSFSHIDIANYLPEDILTKVDRASMKYALEARVPLLDHRIVEFAAQIPSKIKLQNGPKSLLKSVLYRHIPYTLIERPKQGFAVPLKHWFRKELKNMLYDKIHALDHSVFNTAYLEKLLDLHINHNHNYEYLFWNILRTP